MKKWLAILFIIVISLTAFKAQAQTITQTSIDPCDQKVYVVTIPFGQNQTIAVIRGKSKIVTLADISSGAFQKWVDGVFSTPCSTQNDAIKAAQDAAAKAAADAAAKAAADAAAKAAADAAAKAAASAASNAAGNAASSAASGAASNAASNAASGAASNAASSAASGAAGGAASSAAASAAAPPPPPPTSAPPPPPPASGGNTESSPPPTSSSSSQSGGSSSSSSSQSGGSSSSSDKPAESKPAESKSDKPAEQKQEEKKTESKSEEKKSDEKKEESKEEKKDEKKEDKKEEKKKEEKKKQEATNPTLLASDITVAEASVGKYLASISLGLSKSSMAGDESYSAGLVVNSNLSSIVTTAGYTKMGMTSDGQLDAIHSYGTAFAYLSGNYMNLLGYTYIKPTPTKGTYGYNVGVINLFLKNTNGGFDYNMATSTIVFWTKPYQYSRKLTISPQVFTMFSPIAWNSVTGVTTVNRHMGFLLGSSFDYKISKRFGFSFNYKMSGNTKPGTPFLQNFLIGSRMVL
jgi:hypothetical protein